MLRNQDRPMIAFVLQSARKKDFASAKVAKALCFSLTASSTSADQQALGWHLMQQKGMEDLAAFSFREVKRTAAEEPREREKDEYFSAGQ